MLFRFRREKKEIEPEDYILWIAIIFPLLFFGFISSFQKVEANWAAIYCVGASILIPKYLDLNIKPLKIESFVHSALLLFLLFHVNNPISHSAIAKDRLMKETHGYKELADFLKDEHRDVFVDRYQTVSQLSFYNPEKSYTQWPD